MADSDPLAEAAQDDYVIISGVPADTPQNRERYTAILAELPWPEIYKDSTAAICVRCQADIWIGPETYKMMTKVILQGRVVTVLCLFCCAVMAHSGLDVNIVTLTDKRVGE